MRGDAGLLATGRTGAARALPVAWGTLACGVLAALLSPVQLAAQPADGLVFGVRAPIVSMDPALSGLGTMHGYYINIYSSLVQLDAVSHIIPDLATSWRVVDDLHVEFKLRPGVKCHDGTGLDAASVVSSFKRLFHVPNSDGLTAGKLRLVTEVQAPDPLTVVFVTSKPYPGLVGALPDFHIVCASAPDGITTSDFDSGGWNYGSGPYRVVRFQRGQGMELERFDGYFGPKPAFAHVTFREIPNDGSRMAALQAGDVQAIDYVPPLDVKRLGADPALLVEKTASNRTLFLGFDELRDQTPFATAKDGSPLPANPFKDERVRRAFALAISQDMIVDRVMDGLAEKATQGVAPHIEGADPSIQPTPYKPDEARKLLAEAGYPNGFRVSLHCPNDRYVNDAAICQAVGSMLARVGIQVAVEVQPSSIYFPRLLKRDYAFYLLAWGSNAGDAISFLRDVMMTRDTVAGVGSWNGGYSFPDVDTMIVTATQTMDEAARVKLMTDAMGILIRRQAYIPLHTQLVLAATRKPVTFQPQAAEGTLAAAAGKQ